MECRTCDALLADDKRQVAVKVRTAECVMNHSSKAIKIEDVEFPRCGVRMSCGGAKEMRALLTRIKRLETVHAIERLPPVELQIGYLKELKSPPSNKTRFRPAAICFPVLASAAGDSPPDGFSPLQRGPTFGSTALRVSSAAIYDRLFRDGRRH